MEKRTEKAKTLNIFTIIVISLFFAIRFSPDLLANNKLWTSIFMLFLGVCSFQIIISRFIHHKRDGAFLAWYLPFFLFCYFSRHWANNAQNVTDGIKILIVVLLSFGIVSFLISTKEDLYILIKIIVLSIVVMFVDLLMNIQWESLFSARLGLENINSNWNANTLGMSLSSFVLLSTLLIREGKTRWPKLLLTLNFIFCLLILLSGSRTSLIAVVLFLAIYYAFEKRGRAMKYIFIAIIVGFFIYLLIINVPTLYNIIGYRFSGLFGDEKEGSFLSRLVLIQKGFELFTHRPFIGYGLNNFRTMNVWGVYAHCNYVELLVDVGLIGTLLYYSIYIKLMLAANKMAVHKNFILAVTVTGLLLDISMVSYSSFPWMCLLFICFCFVKIEKQGDFENSGGII